MVHRNGNEFSTEMNCWLATNSIFNDEHPLKQTHGIELYCVALALAMDEHYFQFI